MEPSKDCFVEYRRQMEIGAVPKAYKGILDYVWRLKSHFGKQYPEYAAGNIYPGYMDMTYFPLFPRKLKSRQLKIAVVFLHDAFRFEAWLSANNRQNQKKFSELFRKADWDKCRMNPDNPDSIVETILEANPDFTHPDSLTKKIETSTLAFIKDLETYLSKQRG